MTENEGEPRSDADRSEAPDPSAERAAPADQGRSASEAGERGEESDASADAPSDDAPAEPNQDESFDRDGLAVIAAIFLLIGLAVVVEFFWR
jgi:hypothetical protein